MNTVQRDSVLQQEIKEAKERIDEYEGTIHALWSFVSLTTWDKNSKSEKPGAHYSLGRKMTTSDHNRVSALTVVTPDAVIQVGGNLGYVVEAKYSMPQDHAHWEDALLQLIKYDDDLTGWWTKSQTISSHDIVLLVEYARSVTFRDYTNRWLKDKGATFNKPFAIVEFNKADNANFYYGFRKIEGEIEDSELSNRLYEGVKVPRDAIVSTYGTKKFYDAPPPIVEFTMVTLWLHVLPLMRVDTQFDRRLGGYPIYIDLDELTAETQRLYGQPADDKSSVSFPKVESIHEALEELEKMDLARKLNKSIDGSDYLIIHKDFRVKDILEYFISHRKKRNSKRGKQLNLF